MSHPGAAPVAKPSATKSPLIVGLLFPTTGPTIKCWPKFVDSSGLMKLLGRPNPTHRAWRPGYRPCSVGLAVSPLRMIGTEGIKIMFVGSHGNT